MKIFVIHDDAGRIRGTVATDNGNLGVKPTGGLRVHGFETGDMEESEKKKYLQQLHFGHRVELTAGEPRLVAKKEKAARKKDGSKASSKR